MVIATPVVLVRTVQAGALVAELARDVRVDEEALVTILTLRKEFAFVFGFEVGKLALSIRLVAVRPPFASLFLVVVITLMMVIRLQCRGCARHRWFSRLNRTEPLQSLLPEHFCLFGGEFRLGKRLRFPHLVMVMMIAMIHA